MFRHFPELLASSCRKTIKGIWKTVTGRSKSCLGWKHWESLGHIATVASAAVAAAALLFLVGQLKTQVSSTNTQILSVELENRPYLYVDIVPGASVKKTMRADGTEYDDLYLGAKLIYKNVGKLPACDVKTEMRMFNNADKVDDAKRLEEWYVKEFGYFPKPTTIFPDQSGQEIGLFVDAGEGATQYLITIRVSYTGEDSATFYWYSADMRYRIAKDIIVKQDVVLVQTGQQVIQKPVKSHFGIWLLESHTDYDRVGHRLMPALLGNPYR